MSSGLLLVLGGALAVLTGLLSPWLLVALPVFPALSEAGIIYEIFFPLVKAWSLPARLVLILDPTGCRSLSDHQILAPGHPSAGPHPDSAAESPTCISSLGASPGADTAPCIREFWVTSPLPLMK